MKSFFDRITGAWLSRPVMSKMVSFGVVGLFNTVVDLGMFTLAFKVFGLPLVPSNVISWFVAVSGSYVLNTMTTFRAESGRILRRRDYSKFVASGIVGVVATTTTLLVLSHFIPVFAAKLVAIVVAFIVNFTMSHFVVFRASQERSSER